MIYTRFTLKGKFLGAPQQSLSPTPALVVDCDPNTRRNRERIHGKALEAYIVVDSALDAEVDDNGAIGLPVEFRLDDGKPQSDVWASSRNYSAIFLTGPSRLFNDTEITLSSLLYGHTHIQKEGTSPQVTKAVIRVPEYRGRNITMEFDFPDSTEVAESCGLILHKK
jgi:hypothetical protein